MHFTAAEQRIFARRERISVSHWAALHLIVPDGPYAGARYRRDVNPYLAGIMDTWGLPEMEEVLVCGSAQTGKTVALYACLCYCVDYRPAPRMLAMPDDETLGKVVEAKLKPLFRKTRPVAALLRKFRGGRVDMTDGTRIFLSSAASQSQRASVSVQDLFLDEEALYKSYAGQGAPVADFLERTRSYSWKRKIMRVSKPIGGDDCTIWADIQRMDELREYAAICPACGTAQILRKENIITEHQVKDPVRVERERLGRYRCPHCRMHWTDYMRDQAVARGEWMSEKPSAVPRRVAFHLPAILSSAVSLSEIAAAQLRLEKDDDEKKHQDYANGLWAEPYRPVVVHTSKSMVLALRDADLPPRIVPEGYVALTCGVDMQKRGFWYLTCAWTAKLDCAVIDHGRFMTWEEVKDYCLHADFAVQGSEAGEHRAQIWRAALDTGGGIAEGGFISRTEEALDFVRRYGSGIIHATKGASHAQINPVQWSITERLPQSRTPIAGGLKLFLLDTNYFKSWASSRMTPEAHQPLRLHRDCGEDLALQLTAEEQVREKGKRVWRQRRKDNHWFDCLCLNLACVHATWTPGLARLIEPQASPASLISHEETALSPPLADAHRTQEGGTLW
jgi:phage terminase large subunit GpA-like protein